MKKFLLTLALCAAALSLMAQDVVFLKNGSVIKGEVTKNDATTVEITANGRLLTYKAIDVQRVQIGSSDVTMPKNPKRPKYQDYEDTERGYWCAVEIWGGGAVDFGGKPNMCNIDLHFINGFRINEWIRLGVGLGFRYYLGDLTYKTNGNTYDEPISSKYRWTDPNNPKESVGGNQWAIPLYLDLRGNIMSMATRRCVPYWSFDVGYTFTGKFVNQADYVNDQTPVVADPYKDIDGKKVQGQGLFFAPTLGIKILGPRHTLLLGLSYMGQVLPRFGDYTSGPQSQSIPYVSPKYTNFLCGRIAYEF